MTAEATANLAAALKYLQAAPGPLEVASGQW